MSDAVPEYTANEPRDEDAMDDEDTEDSQQWHGNVRRQMWKTVCHRTALNVSDPLSLFPILARSYIHPIGLVDHPVTHRTRVVRRARTDTIHICGPQGRLQDLGRPPLGPRQHRV